MPDEAAHASNQAHVLVEEAFKLAEQKLEQEAVTPADVIEVGGALTKATDHPAADIWVTMTAAGPKNQCNHHQYPDGPYERPPTESPRETLDGIIDHEIEVMVA